MLKSDKGCYPGGQWLFFITQNLKFKRVNGNPSLSNLYDMAEEFGVKITELFPPEDQFNKNVHPSEFKIQTI